MNLNTMKVSSHNVLPLVMDKCRICLEHHGSISIFDTPRLAEDIRLYTSVNVKTDDVYPKNICITCKRRISAAKALRRTALNTFAKLRFITGETSNIEPLTKEINQKPMTEVISKKNQSKNRHKNRKNKSRPSIPRSTKSVSANEMKIPRVVLIHNTDTNVYKIQKDGLVSSQSNKDGVQNTTASKVGSTTELPQSPSKKKKADSSVSSGSKEKEDFRCQICSRNCPSRTSLYLHCRSHNPSKMLHCPVCEKTFSSKSDLRKHNRTHTGERPFICSVCQKGFTQNSTLKAHKILNKCTKLTPEKDSCNEEKKKR